MYGVEQPASGSRIPRLLLKGIVIGLGAVVNAVKPRVLYQNIRDVESTESVAKAVREKYFNRVAETNLVMLGFGPQMPRLTLNRYRTGGQSQAE